MSFAHWACGHGVSPGKLRCAWLPHPSLCLMKGPPCENLGGVNLFIFSVYNRAFHWRGKHSSTELRLALAIAGVSLLPTCPWTPSASEKTWRHVPMTQNCWSVRKSLQPGKREDKCPRHGISDTQGTHHVWGLGLSGESRFFPLSSRRQEGKPMPQSQDLTGLGVAPCSMKDSALPTQPRSVIPRAGLSCHHQEWVTDTQSKRQQGGSKLQSFS